MREPGRSGRYSRSRELSRRAAELIPGGGHLSGRALLEDEEAPCYFVEGCGSRIRDVDGHEYIDFIMAFGPFLLGYAHPEVDATAIKQLKRGHLLSLNHPLHVRFVECLLERFPGAEMGTFFRTGSEATTAALRVARRATGRRVVMRAGYHGWHDWCLPLESFVPAGMQDQVLEFDANDPSTLDARLGARPGEVAAVILAPEMIVPADDEKLRRIAELARAHGAVFVLDEVKTAFRTPPGSMQARARLQPDLTTISKALGNGWPIAALIGRREVMEHGAGMHYSATYHGDAAAMAAAMKTMEIVVRERAAEHAFSLGQSLIDGLNAICRRYDVAARAYGEPLPPMPFLSFEDPDKSRNDQVRNAFYAGALARGVLLHPRHLWFTSRAHSEEDIERALDACDAAMRRAVD